MTLEFHPLANLFPLIEGEDFDALAADVKEHGVREWIIMHDGMILDGRNRFRAAVAAKLYAEDFDPYYRKDGQPGALKSGFRKLIPADGDPLAFVLSKNLTRRHLDQSQKAAVADRLAQLGHGGDRKSKRAEVPTQAAAAAALGVSERLVQHARIVREQGTPELAAAVDRGQITVSLAAQAAKLDVGQQQAVVKLAEAGNAKPVSTVVKKAARAAKEKDLGARQLALPQKRFGVILADPEWRFEPYSRDTGMDRAPENHYPTSTTAVIAARPVGDIAANDCVLFLWATAPMMPHALEVMAAWGFKYQTQLVWVKQRTGNGRGPGFWFTGEHELLLLGTKGQPPAPAGGTQWRSVLAAPVGDHSEKPHSVYALIESYFPHLPKIELNARLARAGWDAWGFEAPAAQACEDAERAGQRVEDNPLPTLHAYSEMGGHAPEGESQGPGNVAEPHGVPARAGCDVDLARPTPLHDGVTAAIATLAPADGAEPMPEPDAGPPMLWVGNKRVALAVAPPVAEQFMEVPKKLKPDYSDVPKFLLRIDV